jgi:hypothetical protein
MWSGVDMTGRKKGRRVDNQPLNGRIGAVLWPNSRKAARKKPLSDQLDVKNPQCGMKVVILKIFAHLKARQRYG